MQQQLVVARVGFALFFCADQANILVAWILPFKLSHENCLTDFCRSLSAAKLTP